jgi:hypothetical protein
MSLHSDLVAAFSQFKSIVKNARIKRDIREAFDADPGGQLQVETDLGSIHVQARDFNKVEIELAISVEAYNQTQAEAILKDLHLQFDKVDNTVHVQVDYQGDTKLIELDFRICVPRSFNIDLKTLGGDISVEDLHGEVRSQTLGGSLNFAHIKGSVQGKTSGGDISISDLDGDITVRTLGGPISVNRVSGNATVETSGGNISIEQVFGEIIANTSGGDVSARISDQPSRNCNLSTLGGDMTIEIAETLKVSVDARTNGGRVITDFPIMVRGVLSSTSLKVDINGGGPRVIGRTSGGGIHLRKL